MRRFLTALAPAPATAAASYQLTITCAGLLHGPDFWFSFEFFQRASKFSTFPASASANWMMNIAFPLSRMVFTKVAAQAITIETDNGASLKINTVGATMITIDQ